MLLDFDDLLILPEVLTDITSRKEVSVYDSNGMLPLFTAPMDTVINESNWMKFNENKIYSIIPRGMNTDAHSWNPYKWYSYGLDEFEEWFLTGKRFNPDGYPYPTPVDFNSLDLKYYALIDIANGHMKKLLAIAQKAKEKYGDKMVLMIGNIANPKTYKEFAKIGVDYVRLGIGNGAGCLTTQQTGVGYPMASLIKETSEIKKKEGFNTKIVADGGFKKFSDINKALALGADYVMLGSIFNKALESAAETYLLDDDGKEVELHSFLDEMDEKYREVGSIGYKAKLGTKLLKAGKLYKNYRGMSTKEVQESWGKTIVKTAEGISKKQTVEYTLSGWCDNFKDYLASAMSYTNSLTLEDFKSAQLKIISESALQRFNK